MTRIVAGTAGGRVLEVPVRGTRPTSDRVREAVFSRLEHQGSVDGAHVLDLYAGSGALALEAMSRGADDATLVDAARAAVEVCRRNVRALGLTRVRVAQQPAERFVREVPSRPWDLVFLDPPYDVAASELVQVLGHLAQPGALAPEAVVVVERRARDAEPSWPGGLGLVARKDYGETAVYYLEPFAGADEGDDGVPGADASAAGSVPTGS
ncbi:16S rRNA (guanine(966)-N(2))-methyltransferase RsmD [Luteimicrobium sp. DT211]|uniref:16S rRNA (guanine(966)-N(2))-methyltransferase RsmD n=1 Tax=Luteimicrobium sp. DT211 TaxID=3393412 RepID=UPI003CEA7058